MTAELKWYNYQQLTNGKNGIKWKIYLSKYIKTLKGWKGCKPHEFEYKINKLGEIKEVRNVMMLADIFPKKQ